MVHRRRTVRLPRSVVFAAVVALVVTYVPLTGLDHLHLHIDHGLQFFHDHLHIGHHEHDHSHRTQPSDNHNDNDSGDEQDLESAVVSVGHAAQVRPAVVDVEDAASSIAGRTALPANRATDQPLHPSWDSRAPPA